LAISAGVSAVSRNADGVGVGANVTSLKRFDEKLKKAQVNF
jgi:hypothetical protein